MYKRILFILQLATIVLLLGRGWQFIFKATPFNTFFFHSVIMDPVVNHIYKTNWRAYLTNPQWNDAYQMIIEGVGIYFWITILLVIYIQRIPLFIIRIFLFSISSILAFYAFCAFIDKGFQIGQFIELSLQFCTPALLYYSYKYHLKEIFVWKHKNILWLMKTATALTFIGHGLYAIGYHPRPAHFIDMVIKGLEFNENQAILFLNIVGYLDIVVAISLFIPQKRIQIGSLYYIITWGFLTSLARIYSNVNLDLVWYSFQQWLPEFLMRSPHFLIPAIMLLIIDQKRSPL